MGMLLFYGSFMHHAIKGKPQLMKALRTLDYAAIYFLIPGTLTPVCLVCLHGTWIGWVFLGTSWSYPRCAAAGLLHGPDGIAHVGQHDDVYHIGLVRRLPCDAGLRVHRLRWHDVSHFGWSGL